ncbi:MAG: cytochrome c biogenesis protein CcsA [Phycisphaerales bacterium]|nr:cytochrome c biogenesis protein CcsA [Phycisphaerales bacterium]
MPLDSYARKLAVQLTGRTKWSAERGPEGYAGLEPIDLFCVLLFEPQTLTTKQLIAEENRPFKKRVGLDETRKFFTPAEIMACRGLMSTLQSFEDRRQTDSGAPPSPDETRALDLMGALGAIASFQRADPIAIVPRPGLETYLRAGTVSGDPGTEQVVMALAHLKAAYLAGQPMQEQARALVQAIDAAGTLDPAHASNMKLELFYNDHAPWRKTALLYGLAIVLFGLSTLMLRKPLRIAAVLVGLGGVVEHVLGIGLRVAILDRAPVSNTYESLLWMGLVGIVIGLIAQLINRGRGWYLFAGVGAAFVSVLFAGMVPLQDQTNALPAVLRSNYWLTLHVLTIVASYGVLAVASVLGHVYLVRNVLLGKGPKVEMAQSDPIIRQTYRTIQVGLLLLTAGTILGGVWAADSWGRFWGWDPKETWALISIVIYFTVLHARHIRWLKDFGLAASAVLAFTAIVWTFYGVNYVMATGLHSYGFGSGGELWVGVWAVAELALLGVCWLRARGRRQLSVVQDHATQGAPTAATT